MPIRRILFLCLLTITLGLTGPFSRGLSSQAAVFPQPVDIVQASSMANTKSGAAPSRRCQRGAIAWSSCSVDTGYTPLIASLVLVDTARRLDTEHGGGADTLRSSRIFRPPRSI
ncbi:MAG: hypothetical protein ABJN75_04985 [Hoeflea sp.]|uniref:hypothetical protein n=1 Tax=Hoeflea sp. TaxID=1940281 RepID=UPI00329A29F8|tara:strand:+ start:4680 stop:5021 length:342 start_codon:yes stop_codon:yes gene_type:complete